MGSQKSIQFKMEETMAALKLAIVYLLTGSIKPNPKNPRSHPESQIRMLARSIATFGLVVPIIVDADGIIIAGHARWLAAKLLGLEKVPTIQVCHLTPAQRRAFTVADNRLSELSEWDRPLLAESLQILVDDPEINAELSCFELPQIDVLIQGADITAQEVEVVEDPLVNGASAVSREGDVYLLDAHRLMCGDARQPASYTKLMGTVQASIVFADAPYNVSILHHASTGRGKTKHREFVMATGEMSDKEYAQFLVTVFVLLAQFCKPGALNYQCVDWRHADTMLSAGKKAYSELKNVCIWVKPNGGMGTLYRSRHEFVLVFKSGNAPHRNNVQLGRFGRNRSNVWEYPPPKVFGRSSDKDDQLIEHPTPKPVSLIADVLLDASQRGDTVLDPFVGSGSTLIAAERTGRKCFGLELDPIYADATIRRWEAHTGKTAYHENGLSFAEVAKQRQGEV